MGKAFALISVPVFILLVITSSALAQTPRWRSLPSAPFAGRIDDVFFVNASVGWIAANQCSFYGCSGEIWKTTDGGATWALQFTADQYLRSIGFVDPLTGWVGTIFDSNTLLYKTTDGGLTWSPVANIPEPRPGGVCGISVVDDSTVYGSGPYYGPARVIKTTDRGTTWISMDLSAEVGGLVDCYFVTPDSGFVIGTTTAGYIEGYARVLFTSDGGTTWTTRHTGTRSGELCWKIQFRTRTTGYVSIEKFSGGPTYYLKTTDGGTTWSDRLFQDTLYDVQGIGFVSDSLGWIGGYGGDTYETTDAGASWHLAGFGQLVNRFRFLNDNLAYAVGESVYKYSIDSITTSWVEQSATVPSTLYGVSFTDGSTGTVVGENGAILHTTNGGESWTTASSGLTNPIVNTLASRGTDLYAGTYRGIFVSTNDGKNWTPSNTGLPPYASVIALHVSDVGLFAGTYQGIFRSTNNGASWTEANTGLTNTYVHSFALSSNGMGGSNLFAGGDGGVSLSTNNGASWVPTSLDTVSVTTLAISDTNLFAGSSSGVFHSTNNGTSWTPVNSGLSNPFVVSLALTGTNLFVGTESGGVYSSSNNGANWIQTTLDSLYIRCLAENGSNLFAGTGLGIFHSSDNGTSWSAVNSGLTDVSVYSLVAHPDGLGGKNLVAGTGIGVFLSTNNGTMWVSQSGGGTLNGLVFTDANTGTAVGWYGTILRTTSGGATWSNWTSQSSGTTNTLYGVSFTDNNSGSAVGQNGTIIRTTDGGANWSPASSGTMVTLQSVFFANASDGWAVGESGTILRTTDGGASWSQQLSGTFPSLQSVFFADANYGVTVGWNGTILRTTNGGVIWSQQSSGTLASLQGVFLTNNTGIAVGSYGTILRTTNGGTTWWLSSGGTNATLRSVFFTDANTGTAVGDFGTIFRTTTGGLVWVQEDPRSETPQQFSLHQNFPNPFNPSTRIRFELPNRSHITVKIYNILGQEVANLVHEEKPAGNHEVVWDASGFATGIYFYTLQTDGFTQTKKLLLIR